MSESDENKLYRELVDLGGNAVEVARSLFEKSCKGSRGSTAQCPIASFLTKHFDADVSFASADLIKVWLPHPIRVVFVAPPEPVMDFMSRFDYGDFAELMV